MTKQTHDIYLFDKHNIHAIGFNPSLDKEIEDTLKRLADGTYEYVGEIKPIVKLKHREIHDVWA